MSTTTDNMSVAGGPSLNIKKVDTSAQDNVSTVADASLNSIANPPGPRDRQNQSSLDTKYKG